MSKIAIIGAGSSVFAAEMMRDILSLDCEPVGTFALVDIDAQRLELAQRMAELLVEHSGKKWQVDASCDRRKVLKDTDYVISTIEVAGLENVISDFEIPFKYGVDQCIGDTIGPGGLFKALRTVPAWLEILKDVQELAPTSLVMNYTNPMSIIVLAGTRFSKLPMVGLCHSVQHTSMQLAVYTDVSYPELGWRCAGTNHLSWFVELTRQGEDIYPLLYERSRIPEIYEQDPVRFELMVELGAFVTESSGHASEYLPYFRKRPDLILKSMRSGYRGESGFYARNWPVWRAEAEQNIRHILAGEQSFHLYRGIEYAADIIEAIQTNQNKIIYGNVPNTGLIENLAPGGIVEVACLVNRQGIQPLHFGALPTHLAALNQQHLAFHELVVTAIMEREREAAVHALMLDPLTSAVCSLSEIRQLFDEMVEAEKSYLPEFL
jgi:alpha-galactosidase